MEETINFFDDTKKMPEARIEEIAKIKEYLEKNNISIKDLKETADELCQVLASPRMRPQRISSSPKIGRAHV